MSRYIRFTTSILIAMGFILPNVALSQDGAFELEEIVVTARKVGESIQDIPLSVQAFNSEMIEKQQILNVEDLVKFTPGVMTNNQFGSRRNSSVAFRGVASNAVERQKATSSAFVDGIYLPGSSQWVGMNDIERVEMVKGPQSAFFGRATYSGAINYISKTPSSESWSADIQAIVGDNGRRDLWLAAEGPLVTDRLALRVSARDYSYDGAWENSPPPGGGFPGQEFGDIGARSTEAYNVTLNFTPTDDISIKLRHLQNNDDDGPAVSFLALIPSGSANACQFPGDGGTSLYYCGTLSPDLIPDGISLDTAPLGDTTFASDLGYELDASLTSLNAEWDINGSGYTLTSVTGSYTEKTRDYKLQIPNEIDSFFSWKDESFSQELRFASPQDQRLTWMVGAYYLDLEYFKEGFAGFPSPGLHGPFSFGVVPRGGALFFGVNPQPTESIENKAIFASLGFDITDKLSLSVELREEEEKITVAGELTREAMPLDSSTPALAISTAQPFGGDTLAIEATFDATLPRVILDYQWTDNTMIYGSYSEGNNPGGFNPEVIQLEPTVAFPAFNAATGIGPNIEQAKLVSLELGAKHTLADGRGFLNGAIYQMEQTNQRFRGFLRDTDSNGDGVFILGSDRLGQQIDFESNGSTDILGLELAGSYAFSENWMVSAGYNYMKTDILVYEDGQNLRVRGSADASAFETAQTPKHTGNIAVDFSMPSGELFGQENGQWFGRWDAWYQSSAYTWTINLAETESALMHNLRGGWKNDRYSLTAWVENVLDDDPVLASFRTTGSFVTGGLGFHLSLPEPRTFGVTFSARFGD